MINQATKVHKKTETQPERNADLCTAGDRLDLRPGCTPSSSVTEPIPTEDGAHPGLMPAAGLQSGIKVLIYCVYNDLFVSLHKQILSDEDI